MRDEASELALVAAFEKGDWRRVTRLRRTAELPQEQCWLRSEGWSLTYE
jgi:protein-L-isoaspartate(D-aspartate) O-methyltransferase